MKHLLTPSEISAESIVDALLETAAAGSPGSWAEQDLLWGAPAQDFTVTAFSLRAGLLGAKDGRALYHHELRRRIPMPREMEPEIEIWDAGTVPVWRNGVLDEPKYFSFFQDSPFASYNPNYRRKWRAHEMLHGAVGFFWRPDMTRFEFYVAARLNELLPVVHWYGLDEALRPRCPVHQDVVLNRQYCWDCEDAATPYWKVNFEDRRDAAIRHVERAMAHFEAEMETIRTEIRTGRAQETSVGVVNGSSDAVGYLRGHWNRCTSWSFGTWVERYLIPAHDYEPTLTDLTFRVDRVYRELLSGEIDAPNFETRFERRQILDLLGRLLLMIELHNFEFESEFEALLDAGESLVSTLAPKPEACTEWRSELEQHCKARGWDALMTTGFSPSVDGAKLVLEGIKTIPDWDVEVDLDQTQSFLTTKQFMCGGPLNVRLSSWLLDQGHPEAERMAFQALMASEPTFDEEFERFGAVPEPNDLGSIRANLTLKLAEIDGAWIGEEEGPIRIAAVVVNGELRIAVVDDLTLQALENPTLDDPLTIGLIEEGILVFVPAARG